MASWNIVLLEREPIMKYTMEELEVAYIHGLPNDLVVVLVDRIYLVSWLHATCW